MLQYILKVTSGRLHLDLPYIRKAVEWLTVPRPMPGVTPHLLLSSSGSG